MPKYKVLAPCLIDNFYYEEGKIVEYNGSIINAQKKPAAHLELIEEKGKSKKGGKKEEEETESESQES